MYSFAKHNTHFFKVPGPGALMLHPHPTRRKGVGERPRIARRIRILLLTNRKPSKAYSVSRKDRLRITGLFAY